MRKAPQATGAGAGMAGSSSRIQSVDRALDVLEALAAGGELSVADVAARTGLVASTTHRLLATLAERHYVRRTASHGRYALGGRALALAGGAQASTALLAAAARPRLQAIQDATGETVALTVLERDRAVSVDEIPGRRHVRMVTVPGSSMAAHATAAGKAMLAHRAVEDVARLYPRAREPFEQSTPRTHTTLATLADDLADIRRRGYAIDEEEHEEGVSAVAAAVVDAAGTASAAIAVAAPTARIHRAVPARLGRLLRRHADELSAALGFDPVAARAGAAGGG